MNFKHSLLALTILGLTACGGGSSSTDTSTPVTPTVPDTKFSFDATELITNLTTNVIVNNYQTLNEKAEQLLQASLTLLNTPTDENLQAAQVAWQQAREPWEQGEAHIFGPVDALSIDPHLDTWPLNTQDLQTLLNQQNGFTEELIKSWNDDVQGYHTMEFLLFGDGVNDNQKSIDEMTTMEREYLVACAGVFKQYTQALFDAWTVASNINGNTTPYQTLVLDANNNVYASKLAVLQEFINGMIGIVDEVGNGKIAEPFASELALADTSKVESQYSWNSLADFSNNIKGVQVMYLGERENETDKAGLIDFVAAFDANLADTIKQQFSEAITAIENIAGDNQMPFRQAIKDQQGRERIQQAIDKLTLLQSSLNDKVLPKLNDWQQN